MQTGVGVDAARRTITRQAYRLTEAALALFPISLAVMRCGYQCLFAPEKVLRLRHLPCSERLDARWHCEHCQQVMTRETTRFA